MNLLNHNTKERKMYSFSDQLATAQILFQLRKESSQTSEVINRCITETNRRQSSIQMDRNAHSFRLGSRPTFIMEKDDTGNSTLNRAQPPFLFGPVLSSKLQDNNIKMYPNIDMRKRLFSLVQTDVNDNFNRPVKRRVSGTPKDIVNLGEENLSPLTTCSTEDKSSIPLPSNVNNNFSFRGLERPPMLPSANMSMVGGSSSTFFTPLHHEKGNTAPSTPVSFDPRMLCQPIVSSC